MNWKELWMTLFGTTEWLGLNMGFWVALAAVLLIVILMNVLFWSMKPKTENKNCPNNRLVHCTGSFGQFIVSETSRMVTSSRGRKNCSINLSLIWNENAKNVCEFLRI